jgi:hypothetical protein
MRADGQITKVHYKGNVDDFIVIIDSPDALRKWKGDKTVPLVDVVDSFDVFVTHGYVMTPYLLDGLRPPKHRTSLNGLNLDCAVSCNSG